MKKLGFHCNRLHHIEEGILSNGLRRGEFYNFPAEELPELKRQIKSHDIAMSIHAPLVRPDWYPDPPTWTYLCDMEEEKRRLSLKMIELTLQQAVDFRADYVVVHYPSPVHDTDGADIDELHSIAMDSAYQVSRLGAEYSMEIHIEGFGPSPFLNTTFLKEVFGEFPTLKYCFDMGHLNMEARERGLDFRGFTEGLIGSIGSLHLWNNRGLADYRAYRHIPVHPSQIPDEGWADVHAVIEMLWPSVKSVIFESSHDYPQELGGYSYKEGVQWVKQLVATLSS